MEQSHPMQTSLTTTQLPGVRHECESTYGYVSMVIMSIMGIIGATGNSVLIGCIFSRREKLASDVIICFLAFLDMSFNLGLLPSILWMNNYYNMIEDNSWAMNQIKMEAYVCCFYSFATTTFFFSIAFTRYLSINARCRARMGSKSTRIGFLCLAICLLYMGATVAVSIFYSMVYLILTGVMMIASFVTYLLLYHEITSYMVVSVDKPSCTMTAAQRGAIMSLFYTTIISFLLLMPCMSTMFLWCWQGYSDYVWGKLDQDCFSFILLNVFHHPLMAINFSCHPIILFCTSRLLREECFVFIRRISLKLSGGGSYSNVENAQNVNNDA